jgi:hypothetical protein
LLLTVPNQLGVNYNAHIIETILTRAGAEENNSCQTSASAGSRKTETPSAA